MSAPTIERKVEASLLPKDDRLYEVVDGAIVELEPMGVYECYIAGELHTLLNEYAKKNHLGNAVIETLFQMDSAVRTERRPDVAFVSFNRWPANRGIPRTSAWKVLPELAVEVISPSNTAPEVLEKTQYYLEVGVSVVWVIYPIQEIIVVHDSPSNSRTLRKSDTLDGDSILPGFRLVLSDLFGPGEADSAPETRS